MTAILLLAGTAEARDLAARLAGMAGISAVASLAGVTADPAAYAIPVRRGGFGGVEGLSDWLAKEGCAAVIDATHPYAGTMQAHAHAAAARLGLPCLRLLRPPWPSRPGWRHARNAAEAAALLPPGASVLLTSGRKDLDPFADRRDVTFHLRTIEPVGGLPRHVRPLLGRPPFTVASERALLLDHAISHLVTKNAGGAGTAKLDAAAALRLTTIVIDRPPVPAGDTVATVDAAVAWLQRIVALAHPTPDLRGPA